MDESKTRWKRWVGGRRGVGGLRLESFAQELDLSVASREGGDFK